jgi:hypothetical protein
MCYNLAMLKVLTVAALTAVSLAAGTITITVPLSAPPSYTDLTSFGTIAEPAGTHDYQVDITGGIADLEFSIPLGQGPDVTITQTMFPNQVITPSNEGANQRQRITLSGTGIPSGTYFTVDSPVSYDITPTPEPGTICLFGSATMVLILARCRRRQTSD